jgi:hypothetical protein
MGEFQDLSIERSFLKNPSDWKIMGTENKSHRNPGTWIQTTDRKNFYSERDADLSKKIKPLKAYLNSYKAIMIRHG